MVKLPKQDIEKYLSNITDQEDLDIVIILNNLSIKRTQGKLKL